MSLEAIRSHISVVLLVGAVCGMALVTGGRAIAAPATFVVTQEENVVTPGDGVCDATCTLREAIVAANANDGADTITFTGEGANQIIYPTALPAIDASDGITIDGAGAEVVITGFEQQTGPFDGLRFETAVGTEAQNITVKNLEVQYFQRAIAVCPGVSGIDCTYNATNISLDNLRFSNNSSYTTSVRAANIDDVSFANLYQCGGYAGAGCVTDADRAIDLLASNTVSGVEISDSYLTHVTSYGVSIQGAQGVAGVSITNNTMDDADYAIHVGNSEPADISNITVSGNHINRSFEGIAVRASGLLNNADVQDNAIEDAKPKIGFATGITLYGLGGISHVDVRENAVTRLTDGINISSAGTATLSQLVVEGNVVSDSVRFGLIMTGAPGSVRPVIRNNTFVRNGWDGMAVGDYTISRNFTDSNGQLGIDRLLDTDTPPGVTANDSPDADGVLNFPVITSDDVAGVHGTACTNCRVELFFSDGDPSLHGEGVNFVAEGLTNGAGQFIVPLCGTGFVSSIPVTATATSPSGRTSEFSLNYELTTDAPLECSTPTPAPSPSPTQTAPPQHKQGDLDCNGQINGKDALMPALLAAGVPMDTPVHCIDLEEGDPPFGSVNCDALVDVLDTIAILQFSAAVAIKPSQPEGCTPLGQQLPP